MHSAMRAPRNPQPGSVLLISGTNRGRGISSESSALQILAPGYAARLTEVEV